MPLDTKDRARVRPKVIEGEIVDKRFDPKTGEKELLLSWKDDGEEHTRWFAEDELEPVEE